MSAQLQKIIAELRAMDQAQVVGITEDELAKTVRPFAPAVRARILNIPVKRGSNRDPSLRAKIAACVETFSTIRGSEVRVGITVNPQLMPDGEHSLPLMMNGDKPWRHPLFGDREHWIAQSPKPFFDDATMTLGPASRKAMDRVVATITTRLGG
jgi:hypothetical protein